MDGYRLKMKSLPLIEGSVFHSNAKRILNGEKVDIKDTEDILKSGQWVDPEGREAQWDVTKKAKDTQKETDVEKAARRVPHMLYRFYEKKQEGAFDNVIDTEQLIVIPTLINPVKGEPTEVAAKVAEHVEFSGRIDIVTNNSIEDIKTSKALWTQEEVDMSAQLTDYLYYKTIDSGELWSNAGVHNFTKHMPPRTVTDKVAKGCQYEHFTTKRAINDFMRTYETLLYAGRKFIECSERGVWEKSGATTCGCKGQYWDKCPFKCLCFESRFEKDALKEARESIYRKD
jgi:hypothetical protein